EDLALMVGSIALFIIIAVLMYFSRKINWDKN
ncbi:inner membrane CreD family protein, partial [Mucilaginibacter sp.]